MTAEYLLLNVEIKDLFYIKSFSKLIWIKKIYFKRNLKKSNFNVKMTKHLFWERIKYFNFNVKMTGLL